MKMHMEMSLEYQLHKSTSRIAHGLRIIVPSGGPAVNNLM